MTADGPTDLVVTPFTPTVDRGRALRTYGVVAALAEHRRVEVLYKPFGPPAPSERYAVLPQVTLRAVPESGRAQRTLSYLRARSARVPRGDARGVSPALTAAAVHAAGAPGRGRVIADGPIAASMLSRAGVRFVYLAHNVESALRPTLPDFRREYGSQAALRRFEASLLGAASESWMCSAKDVSLAAELDPGAALRLVPNVVDVAAVPTAGAAGMTPPGERAPRALLVGDFSYPPNRHALRFMVDAVMDRVWAALPAAELLVVGHGLELPSDVDPRIRGLGFVPDIDDAYAQAACVVVPLLEGGGSPLKFVEALAHGLPVVATGLAAEGLEIEPGVHFRRADGAAAFAAALTETLTDGGAQIAAAGRRLAENRYSVQALATILNTNGGSNGR